MKIKLLLASIIATVFLFGCEDDCTKVVNIPIYNPNSIKGNGPSFTDNFQEVPCDFEEPVNEPVNGPS